MLLPKRAYSRLLTYLLVVEEQTGSFPQRNGSMLLDASLEQVFADAMGNPVALDVFAIRECSA